MAIRLTREVPLWAGSLLSVAAVASLVEVSGILTRLVGLRREWGEGCGERVCCEPPWAQFPRQEIALVLGDAELQFGDAVTSQPVWTRGCRVKRETW